MRGPNPQKIFKNLGNLTLPFGAPTPGSKEPVHMGVDFANSEGTPIPAFAGGTITKAEGGHIQGEQNFGNNIEITDMDGNKHKYNHLQNIGVKPGQQVQKGQQVATMGRTGAVNSPSGNDPSHLDYRIVSAFGQYKNPMVYLRNF